MVCNCSHNNGITQVVYFDFCRVFSPVFSKQKFFCKTVQKSFRLSVHSMPIRELFRSSFISLGLGLRLQIVVVSITISRYLLSRPIRITISLCYHYRYRSNYFEYNLNWYDYVDNISNNTLEQLIYLYSFSGLSKPIFAAITFQLHE